MELKYPATLCSTKRTHLNNYDLSNAFFFINFFTSRFADFVFDFRKSIFWLNRFFLYTRLVIGTSRTVGSAKKFVRIASGFGAGEFTKTLRKVCTCQKLKFAFLLLEYCKIRECYAVTNAFTIRNMYSLLLYMKCNSPPPKPEVILTNFFAEPTVLLMPITSRDNKKKRKDNVILRW